MYLGYWFVRISIVIANHLNNIYFAIEQL